ncbi:diaminopimelate decarboxylase [Lacticigenium naphthae]|uniref:diaminopimelate decarboxylase n=1 Tax=Lacticigenium naphthae TaxID=515351 RepID=UPI0003FBEF2D|nr:diaminopimelate decarboxylase [Lacticigenium naphthae]
MTKFNGTMKFNNLDHLEIGGVDTVKIAEQFGTPTFVYDVRLIKDKISEFKQAYRDNALVGKISYASKAFSSLAMYEIINQESLSVDVVSGGEMQLALKAGLPSEKIHFHGNNKSLEELQFALDNQIGSIIIDNFLEIERLIDLTNRSNRTMDVLIRIAPGISAHTHEYISTGQVDTKFGFDYQNGQAEKAIQLLSESVHLNVIGIHSHIGSQIHEAKGYQLLIQLLSKALHGWNEKFSLSMKVLNIGGGFGIRYTEEDKTFPIKEIINIIAKELHDLPINQQKFVPDLWIEPGRSIVGEAGTTLYTIGSQKHIPNVRDYVAVDGGMTDNIRPALYGAKYTGIVANKISNEKSLKKQAIAGKCCESGDMLIWDLPIPEVESGDLLAVFITGAYGYSMANNYNRLLKPAVVFVENGKSFLAIRRETMEDMFRLENSLQ